MRYLLLALPAVFLCLATSTMAQARLILQYSTDGVTYHSLAPIVRAETATDYFNYYLNPEHASFFNSDNKTSMGLYYDRNTHEISFVLGAGAGEAHVTADHLSPNATLGGATNPDKTDFDSSARTVSTYLTAADATDGILVNDLQARYFQFRVRISRTEAMNQFDLVGGGGKGATIVTPLSATAPLYLRGWFTGGVGATLPGTTPPIVGDSVPEPGSMGLMLIGGLFAAKRSCRTARPRKQ